MQELGALGRRCATCLVIELIARMFCQTDICGSRARLEALGLQYRIGVCTPAVYMYTCTINGGDLSAVDIVLYLLQRDHPR